jgi:hypothetical protein
VCRLEKATGSEQPDRDRERDRNGGHPRRFRLTPRLTPTRPAVRGTRRTDGLWAERKEGLGKGFSGPGDRGRRRIELPDKEEVPGSSPGRPTQSVALPRRGCNPKSLANSFDAAPTSRSDPVSSRGFRRGVGRVWRWRAVRSRYAPTAGDSAGPGSGKRPRKRSRASLSPSIFASPERRASSRERPS